MAALVGGFVAATTLPAGAQYIGWDGWGGGVGVSVGFGAPGFYGGYAAYPSYYAPAPSYYAAAPSYYADAPEVYAYSGPSYGVYRYAGAPAYSYGSTTIYEPGYAYGGSGYVGGYREGVRSRSYAAGSYAAGGYREGVRSRSAIRSARAEVGDRTFSRGTRGTTLRTGSNVRSTSAARPRGSAQNASMRGNETTGRGGTSTGARGGARMQPSGMSGGASMQGGTTGQSGQMGGQPGAGR
ncbi:MAG: hypothetical protein E6G76_26280 [Alphaproteobacteria bacterium]|nr:MAG: hypothetical protein E6G76_26280 [Alphaproteobacteria bacterium]